MRKQDDEAFLLSLHVACDRAEKDGFHHTAHALLAIFEREVNQTHHMGAQMKKVGSLA